MKRGLAGRGWLPGSGSQSGVARSIVSRRGAMLAWSLIPVWAATLQHPESAVIMQDAGCGMMRG